MSAMTRSTITGVSSLSTLSKSLVRAACAALHGLHPGQITPHVTPAQRITPERSLRSRRWPAAGQAPTLVPGLPRQDRHLLGGRGGLASGTEESAHAPRW